MSNDNYSVRQNESLQEQITKKDLPSLLEEDSIEGSLKFFLYLLEHYDEVEQLPNEVKDNFPNRFRHIKYVFERDGLHTTQIEVVDYKSADLPFVMESENAIRKYSSSTTLTYYEIDVIVKNGGWPQLPEGNSKWIAGFVGDKEHYVDIVLP